MNQDEHKATLTALVNSTPITNLDELVIQARNHEPPILTQRGRHYDYHAMRRDLIRYNIQPSVSASELNIPPPRPAPPTATPASAVKDATALIAQFPSAHPHPLDAPQVLWDALDPQIRKHVYYDQRDGKFHIPAHLTQVVDPAEERRIDELHSRNSHLRTAHHHAKRREYPEWESVRILHFPNPQVHITDWRLSVRFFIVRVINQHAHSSPVPSPSNFHVFLTRDKYPQLGLFRGSSPNNLQLNRDKNDDPHIWSPSTTRQHLLDFQWFANEVFEDILTAAQRSLLPNVIPFPTPTAIYDAFPDPGRDEAQVSPSVRRHTNEREFQAEVREWWLNFINASATDDGTIY